MSDPKLLACADCGSAHNFSVAAHELETGKPFLSVICTKCQKGAWRVTDMLEKAKELYINFKSTRN